MQIDTFSHDNGLQLLVVIFPRFSSYINELNAIQMSQLLIVIFPPGNNVREIEVRETSQLLIVIFPPIKKANSTY